MKISDLLIGCGVKNTDLVVLHSRLTEKTADLEALLEDLTAFLADGVLIMPTGANPDTAVSNGIFDPEHSVSGEGALSELFRQKEGVIRSLHPTGSLAALGKGSAMLMEGHERCVSAFSAASPWWRIFQAGGKCVFLGCGLECAGLIAAVEEWIGVARLSKRFRPRRLRLKNGRNKCLKIKVHTGNHHLNYPKAEKHLEEARLLVRVAFDCCDVIVMDIAGSVEWLLKRLRKKSRFFAARRKRQNLKNDW